ncbi:MAG: ribosome-associated translation inhibitor RaiA [Patescibacteria group bacterium]
MNIHVKTKNLTITPDIQDYLDKKIGSLDKLIDPLDTSVSCQVELGRASNHHKSGDIFRAEINLRKDGKQFRAVSEHETLMAAMDEAKDEILQEFKSYKSKRTTLVRRGGAAIKNMMKGISSVGGSIGSFSGRIGGHIGGRFRKWRGK